MIKDLRIGQTKIVSYHNTELNKKITVLLSKLKEYVDMAEARGFDAPEVNLCDLSVPGTNLFCEHSHDIPRDKMPQLKGKPIEGTQAAELTADDKGEVDCEALFKTALLKAGYKIEKDNVPVDEIKSTQNELSGSKVAGMVHKLKENPKDEGINTPIFISADNYILDGHHRWAALVGYKLHDVNNPVHMDVMRVNANIPELLAFAKKFSEDVGLETKKIGAALASLQVGQYLVW